MGQRDSDRRGGGANQDDYHRNNSRPIYTENSGPFKSYGPPSHGRNNSDARDDNNYSRGERRDRAPPFQTLRRFPPPFAEPPRARQRYDARRVSGAHAPVDDRIFARRICVDRRRPSSWLAPSSARRRPGKRSHDSDSATPLRNTDRFTTTTRGSWNPPPRATP